MANSLVFWILRIAIAGEFLGHGVFALQSKKVWVQWISQLTGAESGLATQLLFLVGLLDLLVAVVVLLKPVRVILLWAIIWGFWTALVRPLVGADWLDFVERSANWAAPLALFYFYQAKKEKDL